MEYVVVDNYHRLMLIPLVKFNLGLSPIQMLSAKRAVVRVRREMRVSNRKYFSRGSTEFYNSCYE